MEKLINKEIFNSVKSEMYRILTVHVGEVAHYFTTLNNSEEKELPAILRTMPLSLCENRTIEEAAAIFIDMLFEAIENLDKLYNEVKSND